MTTFPYVSAQWQRPRRPPTRKPTLIVIHTMEAGETSHTAESCATYFHNGSGGRPASAHYCVDNDSIVECVHPDRCAYGAGGSLHGVSINDAAIHIEHAGFASQTPEEWADPYSQGEMFWSSILAAQLAKPRGIPARQLSVADLKAGRWDGFCGHNTVQQALPSTGHTDPGPNFPWGAYMTAVGNWLLHV